MIHAFLASIGLISANSATWDSVVIPFANMENDVCWGLQYLAMFPSLSPGEEIRSASAEALQRARLAYRNVFSHDHLFKLFDKVYKEHRDQELSLKKEDAQYLERVYRDFEDHGMTVDSSRRERIGKINEQITELKAQFTENIGKGAGSLWKTEEQLKGLSRAKLEGLERNEEGQRKVPLTALGASLALSQCDIAETRKDVFLRSSSAFPQNEPLFAEKIKFAQEAAQLLGYSSFAEQVLRKMMIKTPEAAEKFLADMKIKIDPIVVREMKAYQDFSGQTEPLHIWDWEYYNFKMLKEQHNADHELVSEYFPAENTIRSMLDVFEDLFDLCFVEVQDAKPHEVWVDDIRVFEVWDKAPANNTSGESQVFIAHLYTDIYIRAGKYNHAANFNLRPVGYFDQYA